MRTSCWLALLVIVGALGCADGSARPPKARPGPRQQQPATKQQQPAPAQVAGAEVVEGTGKNKDVALGNAAVAARAKVEELLRKRLGEGGWKRREYQLEPDYLQDMGVITLESDPKAEVRQEAVVVARYRVALPRKYLEAIQMDVVEGFGKNAAAAREQAAHHAREQVDRLLVDRYGQDGWLPPKHLLEPELLERLGVITLDGEPKSDPRPALEQAFVARYRVGLTPDYLQEIQKAVRGERMQDRHAVLLRVLAGAVVLLLVTTGYLRLEEMTRGYATALLRGAAAAIVLLAGVGLWLTF